MPDAVVDQLHRKLKTSYPLSKRTAKVGVHVNIEEKQTKIEAEEKGYRLSNTDGTDVVVVTSSAFSHSRLAPYLGWEQLRGLAEEEWQTWKRAVGYKKISRIGVRFINRIDIPAKRGSKVLIEDYLRLYPQVPENGSIPSLNHYTMQVAAEVTEIEGIIVVNSGSVASPLVDHSSFVLDLDISRQTNIPQNDKDLWAFVETIRSFKNSVFEMCITDKSREIFDS